MKGFGKISLSILLSCVGLAPLAAVAVTVYFYIEGRRDADVAMVDDADLRLPVGELPDEENAFLVFASATNHYAVLKNNCMDERLSDYGFIEGYQIAFPDPNSLERAARDEAQAAARADAILAAHEPFFDVLAEGVRCKGYRTIPSFEVLHEKHPLSISTIMTRFRNYGNLLCLKAQRELERGEREAATQTIVLLHAIGAKMVAQTDSCITTFMGTALKQKAYRKMVDAMGMGLLTDAMGDTFAACVEADVQSFKADYERMIRAEYMFQVAMLERMTSEDLINGWLATQFVSLSYERTFSESCAEGLQRAICHWPGYLRFAYHPRTTRLLIADLTRRVLQGDVNATTDKNIRFLTPNHIGRSCVSVETPKTMMPAFKSLRFDYAKVQLVLATAKWKQRNSAAYPPSLEALVPDYLPAVPADPWSDDARPLAYHPATGTVWTIGAGEPFDYHDYLEAPEVDKDSGMMSYELRYHTFRLDGKPHLLPPRE